MAGTKNSGRRINDDGTKPQPMRVVLPNGSLHLVGISAAARWLGCSQSALYAVVRGVPNRGTRLLNRARAEFPQLFEKTANAKRRSANAR